MAPILPDDAVVTVAVLGAIGPDKGARRLERLVELARRRRAPIRFVLIGYMDVQHDPWQSDDAMFTVHGRYETGDLPDLVAHYRVALVLYPSAGPETFSYTLTEAWTAGRPVLVPPIGALNERVRNTDAGWVMTEQEWRDEECMLDRLVALLNPSQRDALHRASIAARAMPHATLQAMAECTFAQYDAARDVTDAAAVATLRAFSTVRVRDALGYRPWTPPTPQSEASAAAEPAGRFAHAALAVRRTLPGRVLYRLTPGPLRERLKRRLRK